MPLTISCLNCAWPGKPEPSVNACAVVAERRHPGAAAVVVLAPGDRMEVAVARVRRALASASVFSSTVARNFTSRRERHRGCTTRRGTAQRSGRPSVDESLADDVDRAVLVGAVVVVVGVAEQALVPRPVVLGAERVVDADEAAAGADVLAQRGLGRVEVRAGGGVDRERRIDARVPCFHSVSRLVLGEDHRLVLGSGPS